MSNDPSDNGNSSSSGSDSTGFGSTAMGAMIINQMINPGNPSQPSSSNNAQQLPPGTSGGSVGNVAYADRREYPAIRGMANFDPDDIKIAFKVVKQEGLDQHNRPFHYKEIVGTVTNTSASDIRGVGVGATNGNKRWFGLRQPTETRMALDPMEGQDAGTIQAGQSRTITLPKHPNHRYRLGTYLAGVQPDGQKFNVKRKPTVYWQRAKRWGLAAIAVVPTALATLFVAFAPKPTHVPNTNYGGPTAEQKADKALTERKSSKPTKAAKTNATLTKNYVYVADDGSKCTIPAGTALRDKGHAKDGTWAEARDLVSFPNVEGNCKGKISPGQTLGVPRDSISVTGGSGKTSYNSGPARPYKTAQVTFNGKQLG